MSVPPAHVAVLAGGAGQRMRADFPKPLQTVFFRPMIRWALDAAASLPHRSLTLVVGRGEREYREQCRGYPDLRFVRQESPLGTADAVRALLPALEDEEGDLLVVAGDAVLLPARSMLELRALLAGSGAACAAARGGEGPGEEALAYAFRLPALRPLLRGLPPGPGGETRLADAAAALAERGEKTAELRLADPAESAGVDDFEGLWRAESELQRRHNRELMLRGVRLEDPLTTVVDPRARVDPGARLEAGCAVIDSIVESGAVLERFCRVTGSEIRAGTRLLQGTCLEDSLVGRDCRVGPYAHLRHGTRLEDSVWVGNYAELKGSSLGAGTRAAHRCFLADAEVGRRVVIGCGFVASRPAGRPFGERTVIEDDVFIGDACQTVAPVRLGARSFVATGTCVTEDAPPDSFVISRGRQVTKAGYAKKMGRISPA